MRGARLVDAGFNAGQLAPIHTANHGGRRNAASVVEHRVELARVGLATVVRRHVTVRRACLLHAFMAVGTADHGDRHKRAQHCV